MTTGWPPPPRRIAPPAHRHPRWLRALGPGLITGAADDDPSGIATYSQAGAKFGYGLLWSLMVSLPLMIAVQEAAARIGAATGEGLARVTGKVYSRAVLVAVVQLVFGANVINIAADIAAVAASVRLLLPVGEQVAAVGFVIFVVVLEVYVGYHLYAKFLKAFAVALLSYVATAFIVAEPWGELLKATVLPQIEFSTPMLFMLVAILGTTISPYMFFWQAAEEVEEIEDAERDGRASRSLRELRVDNATGMLVSQLGAWFMMVTTATVLHGKGVTEIKTAADAARALEPLVQSFPDAGVYAKGLFAFGVVGMGLLGVPVLAGSAAYAVSEAFGWREGLNRRPSEAGAFYGVLVLATSLGLALTLTGLDPIQLLIYAAAINGIVSVPLIFLIGRIARDPRIMGSRASGRLSRVMLALTFALVAASVVALFWSLLSPGG